MWRWLKERAALRHARGERIGFPALTVRIRNRLFPRKRDEAVGIWRVASLNRISRLASARAAPDNRVMASFEVQAPGARQAAMTASPQQAAFRGPGLRVLSRILLCLLILFAVAALPAMAQSILRDAETEALLPDIMDPDRKSRVSGKRGS